MDTSANAPTIGSELIGTPVEDLDTPALLLDRKASDHNIQRMAEFFGDKKSKLRPHFKNHKCPSLARRQMEAGSAVGFTCAKLGEAEVLAERGFGDLLIANQIVGRRKVERLVRLARNITLRVAIDHPDQATAISQAASAAGATVGVLVEVDIGMGRCGVPPGEPAWELAQAVHSLPGLRLDGLQAYEGHLVYITDAQERAQKTQDAMGQAIETRELIEKRGIPLTIVSGGSSATYQITGQIDGVDEIQAGSYATMDWRYSQMVPQFEVALSVLTRVISKRPGRAVLDVGLKGAGAEFGDPRIRDFPDVELPRFVSEEHCVVRNAPDWTIGHTLHLLPSHCCTTCNLHRVMYVHEAGQVVDVWPIEGSGKIT